MEVTGALAELDYASEFRLWEERAVGMSGTLEREEWTLNSSDKKQAYSVFKTLKRNIAHTRCVLLKGFVYNDKLSCGMNGKTYLSGTVYPHGDLNRFISLKTVSINK